MPKHTEAAKKRLLDRIAAGCSSRRNTDPPPRFVEAFCHHASPEDVLTLDEATLAGTVRRAWDFLQRRRKGEIKVRVGNPSGAEDGFEIPCTLVEILNDDMPFLVDSATAELNRAGITVHRVLHPIVHVERDGRGRLVRVREVDGKRKAAAAESLIHLHIDHHNDRERCAEIARRLQAVLAGVHDAVEDWPAMRAKVFEVVEEITAGDSAVPAGEIDEAAAFLRWLEQDHFTFVGYREYRFITRRGRTHLEIEPGSGLGILRDTSLAVYEGLLGLPELPQEIANFLFKPELLLVGKANRRSPIQRSTQLDTVAIRRFDAKGRVVGGRLFAGLFTSSVFASSVRRIPVLRGKVTSILAASGFAAESHDGRGLLHVLETLPRDELFQVDARTLLATCRGILGLRLRQRVALFAHRDPLGRWVSCLVYVPRDRFDTRLRQRLAEIVTEGFGGTLSAFDTSVSDDPMARVHFIVKTVPGAPAPHTPAEIEERLADAARDWREDLRDALVARHGAEDGRQLSTSWGDAFPSGYRERTGAEEAAIDIGYLAACVDDDGIRVRLWRNPEADEATLRLKLYRRDRPQPLSDILPSLENMGVRVIDEIPHRVRPRDSEHEAWVHDFGLATNGGRKVEAAASAGNFEATLRGVLEGDIDDDGFNALVLGAGLDPRRVVILRACCKFLLQAGIPFSQAYMEATLGRYPAVAASIVELFERRFDPSIAEGEREAPAARILRRIDRALEDVSSLDEDRILRRFTNVVTSMLRTNFYQRDASGAAKPWLSFKLDSQALDELPAPRPLVEVFVHSPRVDAVHLRGGKVARGGIRWSDRREDFRTEILGLMKSQMTKNAVIVPVGAKGGFVVKRPPAEGGREALQAEGVECYTTMMRGLLDITDNLVDGAIVPPVDVVRRDGDDAYLVVAADKGTASFSDIANGVAAEYGFWLGDAFASGGSAGYDHKAMGITARGAWESIKRHFREAGVDAMTTDFTCVGVGDMSGDVFGNGALYSRHMKLVAAFNHLHIFIDPDPDPAVSWKERQRLFRLPRSSWADYDRKLISRGGGIFDRSAKTVRISAAMRRAFDLGKKTTLAPAELIRAILKADVDLLFFGGIGTYVAAAGESPAEVGDRANDGLRVRGRELRASIVGEGANLGITQRGRIEYAMGGGRINTDFIDNSAGVDCSDHEVNIKIALNHAVAAGELTRKGRDKLLASMTDEVSRLVLRDNYRQSNALSEAEGQSAILLDDHARFLAALEKQGRLDRGVEFLPGVEEIDERRADGLGLARPELAVLLAYAKMVLKDEVLASDLTDDPHLREGIGGYFPEPMRRRFERFLREHPLRREITATYVANTTVNRTGPGFVASVQERSGAGAADVARAYLACREVFVVAELSAEIDALDDKVGTAVQTAMRLDVLALIKHGTTWYLRNGSPRATIDERVAWCRPAVEVLEKQLDRLLPTARRQTRDALVARYSEAGVPSGVARRLASLVMMTPACDIARLADDREVVVAAAAAAYYGIGDRLGPDWLRDTAGRLVVEGDRWRKAAALAVIDDLDASQARLAGAFIAAAGADAGKAAALEEWLAGRARPLDRLTVLLAELRSAPKVEVPMLSVAAAELRSFA